MFEERPFLATIEFDAEGDRVSTKVTLGFENKVYVGVAEGGADPSHRARLVGEATLRAIENVSEGVERFDLSAVGTTDLGPVRIALTQVREAGWSDYLIGSALVRNGDTNAATAKAVLDAVNRRIARSL